MWVEFICKEDPKTCPHRQEYQSSMGFKMECLKYGVDCKES